MMKAEKAYLVLETGKVFSGWNVGASIKNSSHGEVVFNTSLTGYQEILTDPSYEGQIVVMTPSHIGNTGVNAEDVESNRIYLSGFVMQELSAVTSNWRSTSDLNTYLKRWNIPGLTGVDTRALTRHLRTQGAVNGMMTLDIKNLDEVIAKAKALPKMEGQNLVANVTSKDKYTWDKKTIKGYKRELPAADINKTISPSASSRHVVVVDFGVKQNILRCLRDRGCNVTVVPATMPASEILDLKPDGVMLSNGPGDPAAVSESINHVRDLIEYNTTRHEKGEKPFALFGICLGHQILNLALGAKTFKLKFGHHGANHPVKDIQTGKVDVTTQNHGFAVHADVDENGTWKINENPEVEVTHVSLNDSSIEGLRHRKLPLASLQYHPEASAGPHDAQHLFDRFIKMMETGEN